jgi:hypothetical protein
MLCVTVKQEPRNRAKDSDTKDCRPGERRKS